MDFLRPSLLEVKPYDAVLPQRADKLDANEFPLDLPDWYKKKLALVWEKGIASHRYPDAGHHSLKKAIGAYAGVSADHISVGNGSDELIRSLLIVSCLENRGSVLVAEPTFSMYGILAESLGIPVVRTQRHPDTMAMDLEACQRAMTAHPIRVVCVVSPNSPTGNPLQALEWEWIRALPAHVLVLIDEAYFEFSGSSSVSELAGHPNWVILRTFSKAFRLAAHRVGYAMADPRVIRVLEATRLPYNLPMFSQWAVQLALEHAEELLAEVPLILKERDSLYQVLVSFPHLRVWPSAANFLYFRVLDWDQSLFQQAWLQAGTCARVTGGGIRLTVGTPDENQRSLGGLALLLQPEPLAVSPRS